MTVTHIDPDDNKRPRPILTCMAKFEPRDVAWLWSGRIPRRMYTSIFGDGGLGKSWTMLDLAARISTGAPLPGGRQEACEPQNVVLLNAEDAPNEILAKRLIAQQADMSRVHLLEGVEIDDRKGWLNLRADMDVLRESIERTGAGLVVIDPLTAYMAGVDTRVAGDVQSILDPLHDLAKDFDCAVVGIGHRNKRSGEQVAYRFSGSTSFVNSPRAVYAVMPDPEDVLHSRYFAIAKNNIECIREPLRFKLEDGKLEWLAESGPYQTAQQIEDALRTGKQWNQADVDDWLFNLLAAGPMCETDIQAAAEEEGIKFYKVRQAKTKLGVKSDKRGFGKDSEWRWYIPADADQCAKREISS